MAMFTDPHREQLRSQTHQRRDDFIAFLLGCGVSSLVLLAAVYKWPNPYSNNFFSEAWPAYRALIHGHIHSFLQLSPAYVGSLVLRAPFALLAGALGGGRRAVYVATALPCLFPATGLGAWWARERWRVARGGTIFSLLVICALNPVVILCVSFGHPEDVLGGALCVAAVLMATRGKALGAGLLTALAVINKSWGLIAAPVVLVVLPDRRVKSALAMIVPTVAVMVPVLLARHTSSAGGAATTLGSQVGDNFPSQLLYWFGQRSFVVQHAHYLIVAVAVVAALIWWQRKRPAPLLETDRQALLLLALVLLLRAALDPEDNIYYHVPFLFALMAYEQGRVPRLTTLATVALLAIIPPWYHLTATQRAISYTAVVVPALLWMCIRLYAIPLPGSKHRRQLGKARASGAG